MQATALPEDVELEGWVGLSAVVSLQLFSLNIAIIDNAAFEKFQLSLPV